MSAISERAQKNGFADVGEFISLMIARISERQTEVERLAIEVLQSGPSEPWDSSDIDAIKKELRSKHGD